MDDDGLGEEHQAAAELAGEAGSLLTDLRARTATGVRAGPRVTGGRTGC